MANPCSDLDAATGNKKLYLKSDAGQAVVQASQPYEASLQTLIDDALDDTTGYFGTTGGKNTLAPILEKAFNARGKTLTDYLKEQLSQTQALVQTARDAVAAMQAQQSK